MSKSSRSFPFALRATSRCQRHACAYVRHRSKTCHQRPHPDQPNENSFSTLASNRRFQPECQYAKDQSAVIRFANGRLLGRFRCGSHDHSLHVGMLVCTYTAALSQKSFPIRGLAAYSNVLPLNARQLSGHGVSGPFLICISSCLCKAKLAGSA